MHTGFNFETKKKFDCYFKSGEDLYLRTKKNIEEHLDAYIGENGEIDGSQLQEDWFPEIDADIFLSHSHKDKNLAIRFAGWLYEKFGLVTFIDSCVWGYSNTLLKNIDNKYCWNKKTQTYNYNTRNFSTSHVHMMLSTSLMKMINKSECIIFLNTSNSTTSTTTKDILTDKAIQKTYSPWIYSEITGIDLIKKNPLEPKARNEKFIKKEFSSVTEGKKYENLTLTYNIDSELTKLYKLTDSLLDQWQEKSTHLNNKNTDALDDLYLLTIYK
nr:hypothetical protein [uncultured Clostridium sp.]